MTEMKDVKTGLLNIVLLVRDRLRLTQQTIQSLIANTKYDFGLTVVDDASKEETREWLKVWNQEYTVAYARNEVSSGTGAARNQGIAMSLECYGRGKALYLADNDTYFKPGWDTVLLEAQKKFPQVKIIGGGCHPYMQPHTDTEFFEVNGEFYEMTTRDAVSGYSWLLSWDTWEKFGPLREGVLGVRQSEDWILSRKIVDAGQMVGSVRPEVVIHCGLTDTFGEKPPGWELMSRHQEPGVIYE